MTDDGTLRDKRPFTHRLSDANECRRLRVMLEAVLKREGALCGMVEIAPIKEPAGFSIVVCSPSVDEQSLANALNIQALEMMQGETLVLARFIRESGMTAQFNVWLKRAQKAANAEDAADKESRAAGASRPSDAGAEDPAGQLPLVAGPAGAGDR